MESMTDPTKMTQEKLRQLMNKKALREGHCYETAADYVFTHEGCYLIHGKRTHGIKGIAPAGHAWVELEDGRIYDGVEDWVYEKELYFDPSFEGAVEEKRYTRRQAGQLTLYSGKYGGPWSRRQEEAAYKMTMSQEEVESLIAGLQIISPRGFLPREVWEAKASAANSVKKDE